MSAKHFSYSSKADEEYTLNNSQNLFIIRFRSLQEPMRVFEAYPALSIIKHRIKLKESFPESNTFIYLVSGEAPTDIIDEIKLVINQDKNPIIEYVGSVKVLEKTNIYQIYTGNIFIKFRKSVNESFIAFIFNKYGLITKRGLHFSENTFFCEVSTDIGSNIFELCLSILEHYEVEYCHPEMVVKSRSIANGNEYRTFDGEKNTWIFEKTKIFDAWKYSKGKGVKICVIDDGIDFNHPAFRIDGKIVSPKDMHDKQGNRLPQHLFDDKHGTAVSSILISADEKAFGIAPESQLIPIRATSLGSVLQSDAFYWAIKAQADIIVCSWGPPDGDFRNDNDNLVDYPLPPHTDLAIKYAAQKGRNGKGTIIVFAAGNGNEPMKFDKYASHEEVIGVGATNFNDQPTVYSDYGHPMFCCFPSGDYEEINGIYRKNKKSFNVADAIGLKGYSDSDYYQYFDGTSASCPGLAGVIALVLSANPNLTKSQVKEVIKSSCKKIGSPEEYNDIDGKSPKFGHGLVQADLAIKKAIDLLNKKTMKAVSLHIGINNVDSNYYGQIVPPLSGCINDMNNIRDWATSIGYSANTLSNEQATRKKIQDEILRLGNLAGSDGILLISYSGHGAPLDESQGTDDDKEETGKDQAWVAYDGFLVDDLINECFCKLPENLRIVVISDSCFSGSITRVFGTPDSEFQTKRSISFDQVRAILNQNNQELNDIQFQSTNDPKASVILLSACTDKQFAFESNSQGLFTVELLKTFTELINSANKNVNYQQFLDLILQKIKDQQQPQFKTTGKANDAFINQFPFSIDGISVKINTESKPNNQPLPPSKKFKNIIIHHTDGTTQSVNPQNLLNLSNTGQRSIEGSTEWDKAYNLAMQENAFVEPDNASNLFNPIEEETSRSPQEYISTYPNPEEFGSPNRFIWHLDDAHSQLMRAREIVYPELSLGKKPDFEKQVKIGHIDTGYLRDSPILPENLQKGLSKHFADGQAYEGATDYEEVFPFNLAEQQAHGNATLALLAGGKVDMQGLFQGYFGAIPFAKVISMKISESVALLSGRNFASAIDYAIENKCDVITMSMAGFPTKIMADAVNRAYDAGIVIVSAASNSFSQGIGSILPKVTLYPARFDRVIGAVGSAINHAPYLVDIQKNISRAAGGGLYMQTCYGPAEALPTSLAAYTPNITWFNGDFNQNEPLWTFKGGGTSSATPQIAAAAALYIQKYRSRIDDLANGKGWKKAEIVRQALFRSADKSTQYNHVYGNGLLRATDALGSDFEPEKMVDFIEEAKIAEVSGGVFRRLFRIFSNRALNANQHLEEMLSLELFQLLHRDSKLNKYLESVSTSADIMNYGNLPQLIADVKASKLASDFLKRSLISLSVNKSINGGSRSSSNSLYNNYKIESSNGNYAIISEGISCNISNVSLDNLVSSDVWVDEISIEVSNLPARGNAAEELMVINENDAYQTAILIENESEGKKYFEWCFPEVKTDSDSQTKAIGFNKTIEGAIKISINIDNSPKERGIFDKGKKLLLKVFKWIKPKIAEKVTKPILSEFLSSLGDSKYELLEFDIATNAWKSFDNASPTANAILVMPGLFSSVEKGFSEFFANPVVKDAIKGRKIIGFNMPTLVQGIQQNAETLKKLLDGFKLENKITTIITRSRGGIVARYLLENLKFAGVNKLVMIAPPNEGTQIASSENWAKLLNTATNLANLAFGSYLPILPKLTAIFKAIANNVVDLPGINDLELESQVIKGLNTAQVNVSNYYVVISNFTPDTWLKKVFDSIAVDKLIFKGVPNDTVVPTAGAVFQLGKSNIQLSDSNYHLVVSADSVNHFAYLRTENTTIINWVISKI